MARLEIRSIQRRPLVQQSILIASGQRIIVIKKSVKENCGIASAQTRQRNTNRNCQKTIANRLGS